MVKILFENNFKAKSYFNLSLYQKLALIFLILITLVAFLAPFFAPYDPSFFHLQNLNERPSLKFILGTDPLGRDLFSAILYGTRSSILIGFLSALIISVIGIFVGSLAALSAPWVDNFIMRTLEVINSIPAILVVLLLGTLIRSDGILEISILVGMSSWFFILVNILKSYRKTLKIISVVWFLNNLGTFLIFVGIFSLFSIMWTLV